MLLLQQPTTLNLTIDNLDAVFKSKTAPAQHLYQEYQQHIKRTRTKNAPFPVDPQAPARSVRSGLPLARRDSRPKQN